MASSRELVFLFRFDHPNGEVRIHSGLGKIYPYGTSNYAYEGLGNIISVSSIGGNSINEANEMAIKATTSNTDLRIASLDRSLVDRDICVLQATRTIGEDDWSVPKAIFLGKVGTVTVNEREVEYKCYSASTDLNRVTQHPTKWDDELQRTLVDSTDFGFRFSNAEYHSEAIRFPN